MNSFKNKITSSAWSLVLALLAGFVLVSCGGGGGGGGGSSTVADANEVLISGRAAKGTILNATVRASQIINGQLGGTQKDVTLGSSGDYSVSMPKGLIHLQVIPNANSITQDEATGVAVPLPPEFKFRASADLTDSTATTVNLNITPFSEAGVALAEKSGGLTAANINKANSGIANILGFDHLGTTPIQSSDTAALASATTNEKKLSVLDAAVSNMAATDALGCGVKATYGQTIDCTVAKLAEQFQMNNAASVLPLAAASIQTTANSTPMVLLGDTGYQSLLGGIANAVGSGAIALASTTVNLVQDGIAFGVSVATYAESTVATAINDSQRQIAWLDYQASIQGKDNLITTANDVYTLAMMSDLVYQDKWVNGNSPDLKLVLSDGSYSASGDYTVLNWLNYGLNANDLQEAWSSGLEWNAFYNSDEIIFAYRGTEPTSVLNWWTDFFGLGTCQQLFAPQYNLALTQFNSLVSNAEFNKFRGTRKIVLTGHSLGGGIATYIAGNSPIVDMAVGFNSAPLCGLTPFVSGFDESKVYHVNISGEPVSALDQFYQGNPPIWYPNPYVNTLANLIDSHSIYSVLFVLDAAKDLCSTSPTCVAQNSTQPNQPPINIVVPLAVNGIQSLYSTSVTPYRPSISLTGTNLSAISQISWACTQPNGAACVGSPYVWTPNDWAGKVDLFNDTSMKVYPGLLALGDATGTYNWTATFSALNSTPISIPFSVTYQPQAATGIIVDGLSSAMFSPGSTTISTTTNPVVAALTVSGKNLGTVSRIEWRWSGAAAGSKTWLNSDSTWSSKVTYTSDGKLTLLPTIVEASPIWSGTVVWTGTLMDAAGSSQNITFAVVYQPPTIVPPPPTCTPPQVLTNGICVTPPTTSLPGSFTLTNLAPVWDAVSPAGPAVTLNWTSSSNVISYEVYRNGTKIFPTSGTLTGTTFYNNLGLTSGQSYSYYILAKNAAGSTQSNTINVGPMPSAPVALPGSFTLTNLAPVWDTVSPAGPAVTLNWTSSSNVISYEVYRNGTKIFPTSGTLTGTTFYNNLGLTSGQSYSYYILAKNSAGSTQSNTINVGPMPSAPVAVPGSFTLTNLAPVWDTVSPAGPAVTLNWTSSSNATSYEVYRNGAKIYPSSGTLTGTTFYNNLGLTSGQTYSYYILAKNSAGSTQSNTINVGPMPSAPVAVLVVNGMASSYIATSGTYQPTISLSGSGFSSIVNQIYLTCARNGVSCGNYTWTSANWSGKYIVYSDTSAVIAPVLTVSTDPAGTYSWSITFSGAGQSVIKYFTVTK